MDFNRCAKIVQTERSTKAENNVFKLFTSEVQPILFKVVQTEGSTKAGNNVFKLFTFEMPNVIPHLMRDPADTSKAKAWIPAQGRDDKWITIVHSVLTIHH
ncbi:hypothetical protein [uncultured Mediterranea sp.]|uniref:hypothetical protein n=1 Tax=uncultured Mediterranea sp. TaxID=1926662 RepID=UPI0028042B1D|nr:hypothetical protein [uncultured Mediterranea sp.]